MAQSAQFTQIDRDLLQETLQKKLSDLPPLPAVVNRIILTVNDPSTTAEDLNRLISMDQALAAKILRIVNSSYYGFPRRVSTVTHAVVILGFNTVRNLVMGISAFGALAQGSGYGVKRYEFWRHAVTTAVAANVTAKRKLPKVRSVIEEVFIAGLLHDMGLLYLDTQLPVQYAILLGEAQRASISIEEAEQTILGMDHMQIGQSIAEHWNFPASLAAAIGQHRRPDPESEYFKSAAVVHCADWLSWQVGAGISCLVHDSRMSKPVYDWLGFSEQDFNWLIRDIQAKFSGAEEMVSSLAAAA